MVVRVGRTLLSAALDFEVESLCASNRLAEKRRLPHYAEDTKLVATLYRQHPTILVY